MLNSKDVIRTINTIITKNSLSNYSGISLKNQFKPQYNNGNKALCVCKLNLSCCYDFYKSIKSEKIIEKECPLGFLVSKRTFDTSTKYESISFFSILKRTPKEVDKWVSSLAKDQKKQREETLLELNKLNLDEVLQRENKDYLENLIETLLIGRIGIAIQGISHQFFTPLQGAMSDVKNIEDKVDVEESTVRLRKNFNELNKLSTEVQLLLTTSEEFNMNMLRRVVVHIMVEEIFSLLRSTANDKNIKLHQGYNSISKSVDAIPGQLNIALSNIISNAIKYSFNGFPNSPLEVNVNYESEDNYLIINIENEGCKITEEELKNRLLFNLGYRGKHSKDRQRKGTGTGLYIADEIVRTHGGKIIVKTRFKGGNLDNKTDRYLNCFSVYWPIYIE